MENILIHENVIPFEGIKKKTIYHFSDSHLTEYDELSDEAEAEKAKKHTAAWEGVRKGFCDAYGEPYGEAQMASPSAHMANLLSCAADGDALVIAGDTLDYINGANLRTSERLLSSVKIPYIAVCGNHEPISEIPDGYEVSKMKQPIQRIDFEDMVIVGLDNHQRRITREQIDALSGIVSEGKPIIIVMHVPIMNDENRELLTKCGVYFQLNYDGCPEENLEFIDFIKENGKKIIAVLTGHLHFGNVSRISAEVTQYGSSQGITGNINKYIIGE